jgi:hypothetical protein
MVIVLSILLSDVCIELSFEKNNERKAYQDAKRRGREVKKIKISIVMIGKN